MLRVFVLLRLARPALPLRTRALGATQPLACRLYLASPCRDHGLAWRLALADAGVTKW